MKYGYIRPIVHDEQCTNQLNDILIESLFKETHGLAKKRTKLEDLLMRIQEGDELFVQNIEVLADSLQQFLDVLRLAKRNQIIIHFIDEQLTNETILEGSLLQGVTFFSELQSNFLRHSSTFFVTSRKKTREINWSPTKVR